MTSVACLRLAIASVFVAALAPTWADPDLWGHLLFGADIVAHGIPARDPYAFTSAPAWLNQSWLADVLMHAAWAFGGAPLLVAGKLALAGAVMALTARGLHRAGVRGPLLELLLFVCLAALYPSIPVIRPQLFSLLAFTLLLDLETRGEPPDPRRLALVPVVLALWANLHGSWLLGLVELGIWLTLEIVVARGWPTRAALAVVGLAGALATLATPYGARYWTQLWGTLGSSLRDVGEWRGLLETGSPAIAVWVALVGLGVYAVLVVGVRPSRLAVLGWLAFTSWRVRRVLPFFGLATVWLLAPAFAALGRRRIAAAAARAPRPALAATLTGVALGLAALNGWRAAGAFGCLRIDHSREADVRAAAFVATNHLRGRFLTYSDWGAYVIWHFAPEVRVSIDGRREFAYSLDEIARHNAIYWNAPGALADVEALGPDYVWLPATLPVVPTLVRAGWTPIFTSERSIVLTRASDRTWVTPEPRPLPPCFPADPR